MARECPACGAQLPQVRSWICKLYALFGLLVGLMMVASALMIFRGS